jgi:hypothetical protein
MHLDTKSCVPKAMICSANASDMEKVCHVSVNLLHAATWATRERCSPSSDDSTTVVIIPARRVAPDAAWFLLPKNRPGGEGTVPMH